MARFFRDGGFDVVHSFMLKSAIASVAAGRIAGVRHILTSRRDIGYYHTPRSLKLMRVLNRMTTRVTANCQAAADAAVSLEGLDPAKIDILYNGVDQNNSILLGSTTIFLRSASGISRTGHVLWECWRTIAR